MCTYRKKENIVYVGFSKVYGFRHPLGYPQIIGTNEPRVLRGRVRFFLETRLCWEGHFFHRKGTQLYLWESLLRYNSVVWGEGPQDLILEAWWILYLWNISILWRLSFSEPFSWVSGRRPTHPLLFWICVCRAEWPVPLVIRGTRQVMVSSNLFSFFLFLPHFSTP